MPHAPILTRRPRSALRVAIAAASLTGCGSDSPTNATPPTQVAQVTVTSASPTIGIGESVTLQAVAKDAAGTTLTNRVITWTSSDPTVASITPAGVVTGVGQGDAAAAAASEGKTASVAVHVRRRTEIERVLDSIRVAYQLPALAGAIVTRDGVAALGATGVRRAGGSVAVTANDEFHLGSMLKSMTAGLIGVLVDQKKLQWSTTLAAAFPELAATMRPEYRDVTLRDLLSQQSGLPRDPTVTFSDPTPKEQRESLVRWALVQPPVSARGVYYYSNVNYMVAGVMAERVTGMAYEQLLVTDLLGPLGLTTVGFGAAGTPGQEDEPWQHRIDGNGNRVAVPPSPTADNPPVYGPAGRAHMSVGDWAIWIRTVLRAQVGEATPWTPETAKLLTTPAVVIAGADSYAMGWATTSRSWAAPTGRVLTHDGTNLMNYAVAWLAADTGFGVIVVTNQGGDAAATACDVAAGRLITLYLKGP
jgi:CubicO group peptidase (beta-lactamase class C family)